MKGGLVVGIALVISAIPSAFAASSQACPQDVNRALSYMIEGCAIHASWAKYIREGFASEEQIRIGGTIEWHEEWIGRYRFIERVLRQRCREAE